MATPQGTRQRKIDSNSKVPIKTMKRKRQNDDEKIEDRLITLTTLEVLSLVPNLLKDKLHSLRSSNISHKNLSFSLFMPSEETQNPLLFAITFSSNLFTKT
ncbi:hypothetical protein P8452_41108 [Trifolium repens]|nr:hypothetical protein P8452_41108 [Trifolium repens]